MKQRNKERVLKTRRNSNTTVLPLWIDFFGPGTNFKVRYVPTHKELVRRLGLLRQMRPGLRVVCIGGTYDMKHIGHERYLELARQQGDLLVVGVDSDEKVRARKGPNRPINPEIERLESLCALRCVDLVTLKHSSDERWRLVKLVRPDTFVVSEREPYKPADLKELAQYCGRVVVLPSQAETSSSAKVRLLVIGLAEHVKEQLHHVTETVDKLVESF